MNNLIDEYIENQKTSTEYQKAKAEYVIWQMCDRDIRNTVERSTWMAKTFGGTTGQYKTRLYIYNVGMAGASLWERLDNKSITYGTASRILLQAKDRVKKEKIDLSEAIKIEFNIYDSLPQISNPKGAPIRKTLRQPAVKIEEKVTATPINTEAVEAHQKSKVFWTKIRSQFAEYLIDKIQGVDEIIVEALWNDFESSMKVLIEEFQGKITRENNFSKRDFSAQSNIKNVNNACTVLVIDPPRGKKLIDKNKAKKQYRKLAGLYHPDRHNNNPTMIEKYKAVNEAYQIIEEYNQWITSTNVNSSTNAG